MLFAKKGPGSRSDVKNDFDLRTLPPPIELVTLPTKNNKEDDTILTLYTDSHDGGNIDANNGSIANNNSTTNNNDSIESTSGNRNCDSNQLFKLCHICYQIQPHKDIISPCKCTGALQFVHRKCLDEYRITANEDELIHMCPHCLYTYEIDKLNMSSNNLFVKLIRAFANNCLLAYIFQMFVILFMGLVLIFLDARIMIGKKLRYAAVYPWRCIDDNIYCFEDENNDALSYFHYYVSLGCAQYLFCYAIMVIIYAFFQFKCERLYFRYLLGPSIINGIVKIWLTFIFCFLSFMFGILLSSYTKLFLLFECVNCLFFILLTHIVTAKHFEFLVRMRFVYQNKVMEYR